MLPEAERFHSRASALWRSLQRLRTVIRFMNSGAHPDDESSGMLAALGLNAGFSLSIACATRGEGGQNDIGRESGVLLGSLRTAEMEAACTVLGARLYWLSEHPEDTIVDFGFSKSGRETLDKWSESRVLSRLVDVVRTERPDVLCPTFLDVPGQHGHHRAMTEAAVRIMAAASDPGFPSGRKPWQVGKLFLPAWSGAGTAYDDEVPPPPETVRVDHAGADPVSGLGWAEIGQISRSRHRSQGMDRRTVRAPAGGWPLHLLECHVEGGEASIDSGLVRTLSDLAESGPEGKFSTILKRVDRLIVAAIDAFPEFSDVGRAAAEALTELRKALVLCPEAARHRLVEKRDQLADVLRLASGVGVDVEFERTRIRPGESTGYRLSVGTGAAHHCSSRLAMPDGITVRDDSLLVETWVRPTDPYPGNFDPLVPPAPAVILDMEAFGVRFDARLRIDDPPVVLPWAAARVEPAKSVYNAPIQPCGLTVRILDMEHAGMKPEFDTPPGWECEWTGAEAAVKCNGKAGDGDLEFPLRLDGHPAMTACEVRYPHIRPVTCTGEASFRLRVASIAIPDSRVGYIGGGHDRIDDWLRLIGLDTVAMSDDDLAGSGWLDGLDAVVVGIFAFRTRPRLILAMPQVREWIQSGGTLVTLYHRPSDRFDTTGVLPGGIEIGQPSIRWRVTDPTSKVTPLVSDHPVLTCPNAIVPGDWGDWRKERGLYFARHWDPAYVPILEMADAGEKPLRGGLLSADIGKGRHVHTSLNLHFQADHLVVGAFRLLANLVARRVNVTEPSSEPERKVHDAGS
ncbi:MAG: PIG-L family deacetylase [Paracoccaceae bacterium]|nr:PIG-L family deacetylase [Paracoccaceae bacterium]